MKQAIIHGVRDLRIEERALQTRPLEFDQVYAETIVTALSTGTDLGNYLGHSTYVPGAPDYPRALGYSNVGVIREVGSAVTKFRSGQRIFSTMPHMSAYVASEKDLLIPIPDSVSSEVASLSYLASLGLASLRQVQYAPGENVAIIGLGIIGLCSTALAVALGAGTVAIANSPTRLTLAKEVGADMVLMSDDPALAEKVGQRFSNIDIVILTANPWNAYQLAMEIVRSFGRVSVLGFPGRDENAPDFNPLDPKWIYAKQLSIFGSGCISDGNCPCEGTRFNRRRDLMYILDLMGSGKLRLESLISHRLPANRMGEAYELAASHSKELVTAVFDWQRMK